MCSSRRYLTSFSIFSFNSSCCCLYLLINNSCSRNRLKFSSFLRFISCTDLRLKLSASYNFLWAFSSIFYAFSKLVFLRWTSNSSIRYILSISFSSLLISLSTFFLTGNCISLFILVLTKFNSRKEVTPSDVDLSLCSYFFSE
jgi:hypothetical protein